MNDLKKLKEKQEDAKRWYLGGVLVSVGGIIIFGILRAFTVPQASDTFLVALMLLEGILAMQFANFAFHAKTRRLIIQEIREMQNLADNTP